LIDLKVVIVTAQLIFSYIDITWHWVCTGFWWYWYL